MDWLAPCFDPTSLTTDTPLDIARALTRGFSQTAAERDRTGGTPKAERDAIRRSGLLKLSIPVEYGGQGANWQQTLEIVRELARADGSLGHVFAFHHLMLTTVRLFALPEQWEPWYEHTARYDWFWGNAMNPLDTRTRCRAVGSWYELTGQKSFCSGAMDSEMLLVSGQHEHTGKLVAAAIPTARSGIAILDDWDNMGQRQTDSGSVHFERVRVEKNEMLDKPGPLTTPYSSLRPLVAQLILTNIYIGIAEGAFEHAKHYTLYEARPWFKSQVEETRHDPYILNHYGEFWLGLETARTLAGKAAAQLDEALQLGPRLNEQQRGNLALAITVAKVAATRVGLDLTSRMFEVGGARATHAGLRLDRYWRNLRTHTLHDPVDYKIRELGEWALTQQYPTPTFYS